jgi:hypothetical protein
MAQWSWNTQVLFQLFIQVFSWRCEETYEKNITVRICTATSRIEPCVRMCHASTSRNNVAKWTRHRSDRSPVTSAHTIGLKPIVPTCLERHETSAYTPARVHRVLLFDLPIVSIATVFFHILCHKTHDASKWNLKFVNDFGCCLTTSFVCLLLLFYIQSPPKLKIHHTVIFLVWLKYQVRNLIKTRLLNYIVNSASFNRPLIN